MSKPIPSQIADKLRGQQFETFDHFKSALWVAVADDSALSSQFNEYQIKRMQQGWPPRAPFQETVKGFRSYEICHLVDPDIGGAVYDMDNMRCMSVIQYALSTEIQA